MTAVFYAIFILKTISFLLVRGLITWASFFHVTAFWIAMGLLSDVLRKISCMRGCHYGKNFCIYCGKQLLPEPFAAFRVRSSDGQVDVVLKGINEHHAKWQLRDRYPPSKLTAQRMPDN